MFTKPINKGKRVCLKLVALTTAFFFFINIFTQDILALTPELRSKPFSDAIGSEYRLAANMMAAAVEIRNLIGQDNARENPIARINARHFPDERVSIDRTIRTGKFNCSKRKYDYALFRFKEENVTIKAIFIRDYDKLADNEKLTGDELAELGVRTDDDKRHFSDSPEYPPLRGVWFVRSGAAPTKGLTTYARNRLRLKMVNEIQRETTRARNRDINPETIGLLADMAVEYKEALLDKISSREVPDESCYIWSFTYELLQFTDDPAIFRQIKEMAAVFLSRKRDPHEFLGHQVSVIIFKTRNDVDRFTGWATVLKRALKEYFDLFNDGRLREQLKLMNTPEELAAYCTARVRDGASGAGSKAGPDEAPLPGGVPQSAAGASDAQAAAAEEVNPTPLDTGRVEALIRERLPGSVAGFERPNHPVEKHLAEGPLLKHHVQALLGVLAHPEEYTHIPPDYRKIIGDPELKNFFEWYALLHDYAKTRLDAISLPNELGEAMLLYPDHEAESARMLKDDPWLAAGLPDRDVLIEVVRLHGKVYALGQKEIGRKEFEAFVNGIDPDVDRDKVLRLLIACDFLDTGIGARHLVPAVRCFAEAYGKYSRAGKEGDSGPSGNSGGGPVASGNYLMIGPTLIIGALLLAAALFLPAAALLWTFALKSILPGALAGLSAAAPAKAWLPAAIFSLPLLFCAAIVIPEQEQPQSPPETIKVDVFDVDDCGLTILQLLEDRDDGSRKIWLTCEPRTLAEADNALTLGFSCITGEEELALIIASELKDDHVKCSSEGHRHTISFSKAVRIGGEERTSIVLETTNGTIDSQLSTAISRRNTSFAGQLIRNRSAVAVGFPMVLKDSSSITTLAASLGTDASAIGEALLTQAELDARIKAERRDAETRRLQQEAQDQLKRAAALLENGDLEAAKRVILFLRESRHSFSAEDLAGIADMEKRVKAGLRQQQEAREKDELAARRQEVEELQQSGRWDEAYEKARELDNDGKAAEAVAEEARRKDPAWLPLRDRDRLVSLAEEYVRIVDEFNMELRKDTGGRQWVNKLTALWQANTRVLQEIVGYIDQLPDQVKRQIFLQAWIETEGKINSPIGVFWPETFAETVSIAGSLSNRPIPPGPGTDALRERDNADRVLLAGYTLAINNMYGKAGKTHGDRVRQSWESGPFDREIKALVSRLNKIRERCENRNFADCLSWVKKGLRPFFEQAHGFLPVLESMAGEDNALPGFVHALFKHGYRPLMAPGDIARRLADGNVYAMDLLPLDGGHTAIRVSLTANGCFNAPFSRSENIDIYLFDPADPQKPVAEEEVRRYATDRHGIIAMLSSRGSWEAGDWRLPEQKAAGRSAVYFLVGGVDWGIASRDAAMQSARELFPQADDDRIIELTRAYNDISKGIPVPEGEENTHFNAATSRFLSIFSYCLHHTHQAVSSNTASRAVRLFAGLLKESASRDIYLQMKLRYEWGLEKASEMPFDDFLAQFDTDTPLTEEKIGRFLVIINDVKLWFELWFMVNKVWITEIPWVAAMRWDSSSGQQEPPQEQQKIECGRQLWRRAAEFILARRQALPQPPDQDPDAVAGKAADMAVVTDPRVINDPFYLLVLEKAGYEPALGREKLKKLLTSPDAVSEAQVLNDSLGLPFIKVRLNAPDSWLLRGGDPESDGWLAVYLYDEDVPVSDASRYSAMVANGDLAAAADGGLSLFVRAVSEGRARFATSHILTDPGKFFAAVRGLGKKKSPDDTAWEEALSRSTALIARAFKNGVAQSILTGIAQKAGQMTGGAEESAVAALQNELREIKEEASEFLQEPAVAAALVAAEAAVQSALQRAEEKRALAQKRAEEEKKIASIDPEIREKLERFDREGWLLTGRYCVMVKMLKTGKSAYELIEELAMIIEIRGLLKGLDRSVAESNAYASGVEAEIHKRAQQAELFRDPVASLELLLSRVQGAASPEELAGIEGEIKVLVSNSEVTAIKYFRDEARFNFFHMRDKAGRAIRDKYAAFREKEARKAQEAQEARSAPPRQPEAVSRQGEGDVVPDRAATGAPAAVAAAIAPAAEAPVIAPEAPVSPEPETEKRPSGRSRAHRAARRTGKAENGEGENKKGSSAAKQTVRELIGQLRDLITKGKFDEAAQLMGKINGYLDAGYRGLDPVDKIELNDQLQRMLGDLSGGTPAAESPSGRMHQGRFPLLEPLAVAVAVALAAALAAPWLAKYLPALTFAFDLVPSWEALLGGAQASLKLAVQGLFALSPYLCVSFFILGIHAVSGEGAPPEGYAAVDLSAGTSLGKIPTPDERIFADPEEAEPIFYALGFQKRWDDLRRLAGKVAIKKLNQSEKRSFIYLLRVLANDDKKPTVDILRDAMAHHDQEIRKCAVQLMRKMSGAGLATVVRPAGIKQELLPASPRPIEEPPQRSPLENEGIERDLEVMTARREALLRAYGVGPVPAELELEQLRAWLRDGFKKELGAWLSGKEQLPGGESPLTRLMEALFQPASEKFDHADPRPVALEELMFLTTVIPEEIGEGLLALLQREGGEREKLEKFLIGTDAGGRFYAELARGVSPGLRAKLLQVVNAAALRSVGETPSDPIGNVPQAPAARSASDQVRRGRFTPIDLVVGAVLVLALGAAAATLAAPWLAQTGIGTVLTALAPPALSGLFSGVEWPSLISALSAALVFAMAVPDEGAEPRRPPVPQNGIEAPGGYGKENVVPGSRPHEAQDHIEYQVSTTVDGSSYARGRGYYLIRPTAEMSLSEIFDYLERHPNDTFMHRYLSGLRDKYTHEVIQDLMRRFKAKPSPVIFGLLMEVDGQRFPEVVPFMDEYVQLSGVEKIYQLWDAAPTMHVRNILLEPRLTLNDVYVGIFRNNREKLIPTDVLAYLRPLFMPMEYQVAVKKEMARQYTRLQDISGGEGDDPEVSFNLGMGIRARKPSETVSAIGRHVNQIAADVGLSGIKQVVAVSVVKWNLAARVSSGRNHYILNGQLGSSGKGLYETAALASGLMESLERFSAVAGATHDFPAGYEEDLSMVFGSASELRAHGEDVLDINTLAPLIEYKDQRLYWVKGRMVTEQGVKNIYVPAQMVFLLPNFDEPEVLRDSSNGLAAGNTMDEAKLTAVLELFERDADYTIFHTPEKVFRLKYKSDRITALFDKFKEDGIDVQFLDLTSEFGVPTYRAFVRAGDTILSGSGSHVDGKTALMRASGELFTKVLVSRMNRPIIGKMGKETDHIKEIAFEDLPDYSTGTIAKDLALLEKLLHVNGYSPIYVNLTRADWNVPVVRAIIPGFAFDDCFTLRGLASYMRSLGESKIEFTLMQGGVTGGLCMPDGPSSISTDTVSEPSRGPSTGAGPVPGLSSLSPGNQTVAGDVPQGGTPPGFAHPAQPAAGAADAQAAAADNGASPDPQRAGPPSQAAAVGAPPRTAPFQLVDLTVIVVLSVFLAVIAAPWLYKFTVGLAAYLNLAMAGLSAAALAKTVFFAAVLAQTGIGTVLTALAPPALSGLFSGVEWPSLISALSAALVFAMAVPDEGAEPPRLLRCSDPDAARALIKAYRRLFVSIAGGAKTIGPKLARLIAAAERILKGLPLTSPEGAVTRPRKRQVWSGAGVRRVEESRFQFTSLDAPGVPPTGGRNPGKELYEKFEPDPAQTAPTPYDILAGNDERQALPVTVKTAIGLCEMIWRDKSERNIRIIEARLLCHLRGIQPLSILKLAKQEGVRFQRVLQIEQEFKRVARIVHADLELGKGAMRGRSFTEAAYKEIAKKWGALGGIPQASEIGYDRSRSPIQAGIKLVERKYGIGAPRVRSWLKRHKVSFVHAPSGWTLGACAVESKPGTGEGSVIILPDTDPETIAGGIEEMAYLAADRKGTAKASGGAVVAENAGLKRDGQESPASLPRAAAPESPAPLPSAAAPESPAPHAEAERAEPAVPADRKPPAQDAASGTGSIDPGPISAQTALTAVKAETRRIHDENMKLKHIPAVADKEIVCHIITDSILPLEQRRMLEVSIGKAMDKRNIHLERIVALSGENTGDPDAYVQDVRALIQKKQEQYGRLGYTKVRFTLACPDVKLVDKVLGSGLDIKALAFEPCDLMGYNLIQPEAIMLALRARDADDLAELKRVYEFLANHPLSAEDATITDINTFIRNVAFELPAAKVADHELQRTYHVIAQSIWQAA